MTAKIVNYTPEQTEQLVAGFNAGKTVEALAVEMGKSVRSIVAKLSREGVYVGKAKTAKAEGKVTKASLIAEIAAKHNVEPEVLASLEKATKEALAVLAS